MINLRSSFRWQCFYSKHTRKIGFISYNCGNDCSKHNFIRKASVVPQICRCLPKPYVNLYATSTVSSHSEELVDVNVYEKVCEETLESLTEFFEELIESKDVLKNADVSYSGGVLTVNLGSNLGTYVINRQSPNRQIWLSSPTSGPKRYDYVVSDKYWIYKHDMIPLHKLLQSEFSNILGENIDFSKCLYSKT